MEGTPQPIASTETGRIQVIIEAAEKAAAGIIEDAEAQARRYLEESQQRADRIAAERARAIGDATEGLLERAETLKRHSDELIRALEEARLQIGSGRSDAPQGLAPAAEPAAPAAPAADATAPADPPRPTPLHSPRASHLKPVETPPPEEEAPARPAPERPPQDAYAERRRTGGEIPTAGARLLATQMAVAGSSRAEIERRLRSDFGIEDAEAMLDGILGPES